jgi:two-component system, NarL family, response regulator NreC
MTKIRILVADDHAVLRAGLRLLINTQSDMEVLGEAADFPQALQMTRAAHPDVLLLDLTMPGGNGFQVIERLSQEHSQTRVLVLTMHDDASYLQAALAAGAAGYVGKKVADSELLSAIRAVAQGRAFVDLHMSRPSVPKARDNKSASGTPAKNGAPLSQREREVLELLAQGHTNQAVADRIFLSVKTVEGYRARLMQKLGLSSRADLTRYAVEMGLLTPGKYHAGAPPI